MSMRRLIASFLLGTMSFAWLFAWNVGVAQAVSVPCYCRYTDPNRLFGEKAKLYCMNEVYVGGKVEQGDAAACLGMCAAQNAAFVSVAAGDPAGFGETYNMIKDEKDQCVYFPGNFSEIDGWNSTYADCHEPLNSIKGSWPNACSFCFCKFKSVAGLNATCVGKTTMAHATSAAPANCQSMCATLGLDFDSLADNYGDRCDYRSSNGCSAPLNSKGTGCDATLSNAALLKERVMMRGSVVTLPLPLSNISIPGLIGRVLNAVLGVVGAVALLMFVWGGFQWMTAAGNTDQMAKAKKTLVWATLGLVAIFGSYAILSFVINAIK